jgi:hypothetical protein
VRPEPECRGNEELEAICAPTSLENGLGAAGCLGTLAALLLLLPAVVFGSFFKPAFAGVALVAAAAFWGLRLAGLPKRVCREELAWRRGLAPFSRYVDEARAELARSGADWIVLFTMAALPHGGSWWLRIAITEAPRPSAQARLLVSGRGLPHNRLEPELPGAALQDLLAMLKELDLEAVTDVSAMVLDGTPCRLAVLRREPGALALGSCNLGGLDNGLQRLPTVAACLKLADIARSLTPAREDRASAA